jgi:hypothetical protein
MMTAIAVWVSQVCTLCSRKFKCPYETITRPLLIHVHSPSSLPQTLTWVIRTRSIKVTLNLSQEVLVLTLILIQLPNKAFRKRRVVWPMAEMWEKVTMEVKTRRVLKTLMAVKTKMRLQSDILAGHSSRLHWTILACRHFLPTWVGAVNKSRSPSELREEASRRVARRS